MPIRRLLKDGNLGPEEVKRLELAFDSVLRAINLVDREDPIAEMVGKMIIKIGASGVRDPAEISAIAVKELGFQYRSRN